MAEAAGPVEVAAELETVEAAPTEVARTVTEPSAKGAAVERLADSVDGGAREVVTWAALLGVEVVWRVVEGKVVRVAAVVEAAARVARAAAAGVVGWGT